MRTTYIWTLLLSAWTTLSAGQNFTDQTTAEEVAPFLPGPQFDTFDWRLSVELAKSNPGNVVFSPISVKLLLKMLYEGCTGTCSEELSRILELPKDKGVSRMESRSKIQSLRVQNSKYDLEIGLKIFINETVTTKYWYQRILYMYYDAYLEKINFREEELARDRINRWIRSITHDHIQNLVSSDDSVESTVALLVSGVYFKGTWRTPFQKMETHQGKFHGLEGEKVLYMAQTNHFYYTRSGELRSQILRLPYLGQRFAMYLILPEKKDGLDEVVSSVNPRDLRRHILQMEETSVEVVIPKFKFNFEAQLKDVLRQLGVSRIFESFDDMKGLNTNGAQSDFVISNVIQKAVIEVSEEGTVAAAATEAQLTNKFGGNDEIFKADHPFLFFIEDETTETIVFVGKVVRPTWHEAGESTTPAPTTATTGRRPADTTQRPAGTTQRSPNTSPKANRRPTIFTGNNVQPSWFNYGR